MTPGPSLIRVAAAEGFGVRLKGDGLELVPPTPGEVPSNDLMEWLKQHREALIEHLKAGGCDRCPTCGRTVWLDAATWLEIGAACENDGMAEFSTEGVSGRTTGNLQLTGAAYNLDRASPC